MLKSNYYTEPTELDLLIFEQLVPPDHYLRQVKAVIDFEYVRPEVQDCYSEDMGRNAIDPVLMFKLEFLQYHYTLSDREVIAEAQVNVAYRYFLDVSVTSQLPVPSLLSQFRTRLGAERHQSLFDGIVAQGRAKGLVKDRLRLKDATHIIASRWSSLAPGASSMSFQRRSEASGMVPYNKNSAPWPNQRR